MLRLLSALCFLSLFLTACLSGNSSENDDDFPAFSEEELHQMMQRQNPMLGQTPQQTSLPNMIAQLEASVAQYPDDTTMLYNLAKLHYQQYTADSSAERLNKTVLYYTKVLDLDPSYEEGRPYYNRHLAALGQGNYKAALNDLSTFVRINKDRIRVNHRASKAEILFQQGKLDAACAVYQEAKTVALRDSLPTGNEKIWEARCPN
jgi:tetratricopeptide (TPR) repeat protein